MLCFSSIAGAHSVKDFVPRSRLILLRHLRQASVIFLLYVVLGSGSGSAGDARARTPPSPFKSTVVPTTLTLKPTSRKNINWRTILGAIAIQFAFGALVLYVPAGKVALEWLSEVVATVIAYGDDGIGFLFGGLGSLVPNRRAEIAQLGMKAALAGTLANLSSAAIAGMLIQ